MKVFSEIYQGKEDIYKKIPIILISVLLTILLIIPACTSTQEFNSKLDFPLEDLIRAEERGEAEEFAKSRGIELIDSSVTVIIECEPGRAEAVAEAAAKVGAEQVRVRSQNNWVKAVVPITKLCILADISGVHFVRLPVHPVEND